MPDRDPVEPEAPLSVELRELVGLALDLAGARAGAIEIAAADDLPARVIAVGVWPPQQTDRLVSAPINSGAETIGTLSVVAGAEPAGTEERMIAALAATAGSAIRNSRILDASTSAERWVVASAEIAGRILSSHLAMPASASSEIRDVVEAASRAALADVAAFIPDGGLGFTAITGEAASALLSLDVAPAISAAAGDGSRLHDIESAIHTGTGPLGSVIILTLGGTSAPRGALLLARLRDRQGFSELDRRQAARFGRDLAVAFELSRARSDQQKLDLVDDRYRIARDLHDHVIQNLFGVGLALQRIHSGLPDGDATRRLSQQIDEVDATIRQIRRTIFELTSSSSPTDIREAVGDLARSSLGGSALGLEFRFDGPDVELAQPLVADVLAVVREGLSNVLRHAEATRVTVTVAVSPQRISIVISDNGVGGSHERTGRGLTNLDERARARGGSFALSAGSPRGTRLEWTAPIKVDVLDASARDLATRHGAAR
ncbi:GAF domain-containing sensor histidine kinase [soil metagenome]